MKGFTTIIALATLFSACSWPASRHKEESRMQQEILSTDQITRLEAIVADSALQNSPGDRAWKKCGGMIRIKDGERYYLRIKTRQGTITHVTYRYE